MKREIGATYTFMDEDFILKEDVIVPERKKQAFVLWLSLASIVFIFALGIPTWLLLAGNEFSIDIFTLVIYMISFLVFVVIHELLHGAAFVIGSGRGFKSISFGIVWRSGMAYCISKVPVTVSRARWSLMMPIYVVCIPLFVYGVVASNVAIAILAVLYASGSVGDFYYMWKLRNTDKNLYMHEVMPTATGYEIGYLLFEKK